MVNKIDLLSDNEFIELINNSSSSADVLKALNFFKTIFLLNTPSSSALITTADSGDY